MKSIFFVVYHVLVFGFLAWVTSLLTVDIDREWWFGFNWIKVVINTMIPTIYIISLVSSILSCWTKKALKENQIGQWTWMGWVPEWGQNERPCWYGVFTGLPSAMVTIKAFDGTTKVEKKKFQIQAEIFGDPSRKKFAIEFDVTVSWCIVNTYTYMQHPSKIEDYWNLIIASVTEWMNSPTHNYVDVLQVKTDKNDITAWVQEDCHVSVCRYGVFIPEFNIIDLETPAEQIAQQNKDAAAEKAQIAADKREELDTQAQIRQTQLLLDASKDENGRPTINWDQAFEKALKLRGITKQININSGNGGGGKKGKGNVVPVVHTS